MMSNFGFRCERGMRAQTGYQNRLLRVVRAMSSIFVNCENFLQYFFDISIPGLFELEFE